MHLLQSCKVLEGPVGPAGRPVGSATPTVLSDWDC